MLLLSLDEKSREPKYRQIIKAIREKIEVHMLRPGERLPSTRRLAETLGVHRSTVSLAYQELWALGYLEMRAGARARVRERMQIVTPADRTQHGLIDWHKSASPASREALRRLRLVMPAASAKRDLSVISFRSLNMDRRVFPLENFRSCLTRAVRKHGASLLGYGDLAGYPPLRESIAQRMRHHNISVSPDEIMITNGSQQALDLVLRMIAGPGKEVAIESPSYSHILPLLRLSGLRAVELPVRADGMDLGALEQAMRREKPALVYTMPTFHNPTGVTTDQAHRERLLSICERQRVPILEDAFEEEMKYFGKAVLPIKSMDRHHTVIYAGTFSKVLFAGVRIGWLAAERECIERLVAIRCFSDLAPNMILQAAMDEFCRNGFYDRHVNRMHRTYRRRMQVALAALRELIRPEWAEWNEPSGGYLIWLKLKPLPITAHELSALLESHGVSATDGRQFFISEPDAAYLRLSISTLDEKEIAEGLRRLACALDQAFRSIPSQVMR
jgi:DNA-binding transcriptional MocR family regulator